MLSVVALLAIQLAVANLAARNTMLLPLIWVVAILPGVISAGVLFGPSGRLTQLVRQGSRA